MNDKSYLKYSGQMWKLYLWLALMLAGLSLMLVVPKELKDTETDLIVMLILGGLALHVLSFIWVCLAIKCVKCNARLLWKAMREQSYNDWLPWLMHLKRCPVCQYGAG